MLPLEIKLFPNDKPVRVKLKNYGEDKRTFLKTFVDKLKQHGYVYRNPLAAWACAAHLVPKASPKRWRFTVDLWLVNKYTPVHQFPMIVLEHELCKLRELGYFATYNLSNGYWQINLSKNSQELQCIITPDIIFTPSRVFPDTTNAIVHVRSPLINIFGGELSRHVLLWLEDVLIYVSTVKELLKFIVMFLKKCFYQNIKLQPEKCILYETRITWCVRKISKNGIVFDCRRINGLLSMDVSRNEAQLQ